MDLKLLDIPGLEGQYQVRWRIRALEINGKCPALEALVEWHRNEKADFKKIMKVMRYVGTLSRVQDANKVKKCDDPAYGDIYEMRAHLGSARLMFFYSRHEDEVVICTNFYWKAKASRREQDQAFKTCSQMKALYEKGVSE